MAESMISSFDGTKLFLKKEISSDNRAVVVIVHGLCEHQGRYDYVAEKFNKAGIGTYRFDHRGHGRSEGKEAYLKDFNELLDDTNVVVDMAIRENQDIPVFLFGHSMGGFTVALYGIKYPDKKLRGIITSGAMTAGNGGIAEKIPFDLEPDTQIPNSMGDGVCSVREVVEQYVNDPYNKKSLCVGIFYEMAKGVEWFKGRRKEFLYPVLMLHGEKDGLVSVQDTYEFFQKAGAEDRQMKIYGGLFHEILNEYCRDEVIDDILAWVKRRI